MRAELMRYRNDSLSYGLALLGLALNACYLMFLYSAPGVKLTDDYGVIVGIDTIFNIIYLLIAFLVAEKVKTYTLNWCWPSLVLGIMQIPRILFPIALSAQGQLETGRNILLIVFLVLSSVCMIACCATSFIKSNKLHAHLKTIKNEVA